MKDPEAGDAGTSEETVAELLARPVQQLRSLGTRLAPGTTDRRLLESLVEADVVRRATVAEFLELRHGDAFGPHPVDRSQAAAASARLERELVAGDPELLRSLVSRFELPEPSPAAEDPPLEPAPPAAPRPSSQPAGPAPAEIRSTRLPILLVVLAFLVGVGAEQLVTRGVELFRERALGRPSEQTERERLEGLKRGLEADPESVGRLRSVANYAFRTGQLSEAVLALERMVHRRPDDAELLNSAAWVRATAEDPLIRDPRLALELAERAYALDQRPRIADTLAEASYLNGDLERAVALEEEVVARTEGRIQHYQQQLERFRKALRESE